MPEPYTEVVVGYCYGSGYRGAASWRQELGQIWQIVDYIVYDQKQIKSVENKRRVLGVFIQKLISVRSGRGLQPTPSLSVPTIQPVIIPL